MVSVTDSWHSETCKNSQLISKCALSNAFSGGLAFKCFIYAELCLSLWGFLERLINDVFFSCQLIDSIWAGREEKLVRLVWRRCRLTSLCGWGRFSVWMVRRLSACLGSMKKRTRHEFKHAQPHTRRHVVWLQFFNRTVSKPHKHIRRHPFSYHSAERRKDGRKESGETSLSLTHLLVSDGVSLNPHEWCSLSFFPPSLSLLLSTLIGCWRYVYAFVCWEEGGQWGRQCRWCDWCRVTWFHVNASALREFTLDYAPHCARPMKY